MTSLMTNTGYIKFAPEDIDLIDQFADRIVKTRLGATAEQEHEGLNWYDYAQDLARYVAKRTGITYEQAAGVIAVTSNNVKWGIQVAHTAPFVERILAGDRPEDIHCGFMGSCKVKAQHIIQTGDLSVVTGPKVSIFLRNILGLHDKITLDRHAVRVPLGHHTGENETGQWTRPNSRKRRLMEAAYFVAADRLNEPVAVVQAIVWVVYRDSVKEVPVKRVSKARKG